MSDEIINETQVNDAENSPKPKRRRGRPRKVVELETTEQLPVTSVEETPTSLFEVEPVQASEEAPTRTRRRTRRAAVQEEAASTMLDTEEMTRLTQEMTRLTQEMTQASSELGSAPVQTLQEVTDTQDEEGEDIAQPRRRRRSQRAQETTHDTAQQQSAQQNGRRRNRVRQDAISEPSLTKEMLQEMKLSELRAKAQELEIDALGMKKPALIDAIYDAAALAEGFHKAAGVLEIQNDGYGFLRTQSYMQGPDDSFVFQQTIRAYGLRSGDYVEGTVGPARGNNKYPPIQHIDAINGRDPELIKHRPDFKDLTPIFPDERLVLEHGKDSITGRAIDLVAPIGKGQRGLIVSPPKAGKTTILKRICESIAINNPEVHLIVLLVDERPEEVTDMQRSVKGDVVASTFDMPAENHTTVAELVIERAKRLVELGEDVVVVLDSITRLARAYNLAAPASGRILSGGVDSAALYPPKRFLGAARNIEGGGSLTIIASALIDTGSKMDEVIFEEFKGTGNMELKLDRDLADKRIFPAIDPVASGTRNEELLIDVELQPFVWGIRRILANMNNVERAEASLIKSLMATNNNQEFLVRSAKKAQLSEYSDAL